MDEAGTAVRIRVSREIAADPTSTALLLAGPAALELWPGVRRVGAAGRRALVEAELVPGPGQPPRTTAATVRALPPVRLPTAFVTRFEWAGPDLPATSGVLRLTYSCGSTPSTRAELELSSQRQDGPVGAPVLRAMAQEFLDNLSAAAERRSSAA